MGHASRKTPSVQAPKGAVVFRQGDPPAGHRATIVSLHPPVVLLCRGRNRLVYIRCSAFCFPSSIIYDMTCPYNSMYLQK